MLAATRRLVDAKSQLARAITPFRPIGSPCLAPFGAGVAEARSAVFGDRPNSSALAAGGRGLTRMARAVLMLYARRQIAGRFARGRKDPARSRRGER